METLAPSPLDPDSLSRRNRLVSLVEISDGLIGVRRHPCAAAPIHIDADEGYALNHADEVATVVRSYGGVPTAVPEDGFDNCEFDDVEHMWATFDERLELGQRWSVEWWERRRARDQLGMPHEGGGQRGRIGGWSPASRRRMIRACASADWSSFIQAVEDGRPVALITPTLPGMWENWVPDAKEYKRLMRLLWARWERKYGPVEAVWKCETQRRGAPHTHIYAVIPGDLDEFRVWFGLAWNDLVTKQGLRRPLIGPTSNPYGAPVGPLVASTVKLDKQNHLKVALHPSTVDPSWAQHAGSPGDISHYFAKHGAAGGHGRKEYQHDLPHGWATIGRWWGVRRLKSTCVQRPIRDGDGLQLLRALRSWQGAGNAERLKDRLRLHGGLSQDSTVERQRAAKRSFVQGRKNAKQLRWLAVNDAPDLAVQLLRVLEPACGPPSGRWLP